ncbi:MAG: pyridoxal-phosphate dependent enzyme, partial [Thermoanaerobaculia bacterium]|nr:pyridoxal-phosphate dependent enzyme [Thermoanaerobaculia bacterium]
MKPPLGGESWARRLRCTATNRVLPLDRPAFLSAAGRPLAVEYELEADWGGAWRDRLAGRPWDLWRYRELLPVADVAKRVGLGEGGTPLLRIERTAPDGLEVWLKQEAGNPTGSFKDRGLALAVSRARELGAPGVELPSAGNAGISLAAYAARAGLPCRVALP